MTTAIAFIFGVIVSFAAIVVPHSRAKDDSMKQFQVFQHTLATLPAIKSKKHYSRSK